MRRSSTTSRRLVLGLSVAALLLFALGWISRSSMQDRGRVGDADVVATAGLTTAVSAAGASVKPLSIVLGAEWSLVALLLVAVIAASAALTGSSSRSSWCRRRAPPAPAR
jgi:hypothetical protein